MDSFASPPTDIMNDQTMSGEERAETLMALLRDERNAMRIIVAAARKLKQEKEELQAEREELLHAANAGREAVARAHGAETRIRMLEALLAEERANPSADAQERLAALELLLRDERQAMVILVEASDSLRFSKNSLTAERDGLKTENESLRATVEELKREGTHPAMEHMWRVSTGPDSAGVGYRKTANFEDKLKNGLHDIGLQDGEVHCSPQPQRALYRTVNPNPKQQVLFAKGLPFVEVGRPGDQGILFVECSNGAFMPINTPTGSYHANARSLHAAILTLIFSRGHFAYSRGG